MKTPPRSKRVEQESELHKVTTPVALRAAREKKHCSKARAVRVRPEYPLTRTTPEMKLMPPEFFQIDALDLAPRLLGKFLRRDNVVLRITEVEAYRPNDSACHGRFGNTPRTAPIFGPGGHAYVYLCYGLHMMLNIVADKDGVGAAVLIRSCSPVTGLETIQERRGQKTDKPVLLNGPGKVSLICIKQNAPCKSTMHEICSYVPLAGRAGAWTFNRVVSSSPLFSGRIGGSGWRRRCGESTSWSSRWNRLRIASTCQCLVEICHWRHSVDKCS
ncbi:DNA-3-methyladenine glycosylase isoform X1 [Brassica rapa]|uniref:DNA-3-methyladenine glycosylase isoform X1 n=1 Tax=Brassica campestris TaxID=3711 RepID=UPI00142DBF4B|nr:DNA-3-methyladenine glycosylase isoform X1 [Brassica rapa]